MSDTSDIKFDEPSLIVPVLPDTAGPKTPPCIDDPTLKLQPAQPYDLPGPQVEPGAAYWLLGKHLPQVVPISEVTTRVTGSIAFPTDVATITQEISELANRAHARGTQVPAGYLSKFINLQNLPFGAIFNTTHNHTTHKQYRVKDVNHQDQRILRPSHLVTTYGELARMFESETPGLLHRHALNWLLYNRSDVSPPRHARIWMALDVTLYSALSAAWHYKWAGINDVSYRLRPYEYDRGQTFAVLFDKQVPDSGAETYDAFGRSTQGAPRTCPCPSPGTPRHPAYPSGHSTYSAAASRILEYFFSPTTLGLKDAAVIAQADLLPHATLPELQARLREPVYVAAQLRKLAINIGEARLDAGVHWRSDHTFGRRVGRAVADAVIVQMQADCVVPILHQKPCPARRNEHKPTLPQLHALKALRLNHPCPNPNEHDTVPHG